MNGRGALATKASGELVGAPGFGAVIVVWWRLARVAPRQLKDDQINAARQTLASCWFDAASCSEGLRALRSNSGPSLAPHGGMLGPPAKALSLTPA